MFKNFCNCLLVGVLVSMLWSGSCLEIKDPEFIKMRDWHISKVSAGYFEVTSKAQFYNPNKVGLTLTNVYVDVFLNILKLLSAKTAQIKYSGYIQVKKANISLKIDIIDKYEFNIKDLNIFK
jgi:LEA14-like dessication related protein